MPTNRTLLKLSALLIVSALVAGTVVSCGPTPSDGSVRSTSLPRYDTEIYGELESINPHGQVVVLWHSFRHDREELFLTLIDEFNAKNEWGIRVIGEYGGPADVLHEHVLSRIGSRRCSICATAWHPAMRRSCSSAKQVRGRS